MNPADLRRAENLLDRLTIGNEQKHTPELIRQVRDDELIPDSDRNLLTAYAWHLQSQSMCPRDSKVLLLRFSAYAEAERDAWDLSGEDFTERHGFPPQELPRFRDVLVLAAAETVEALT
jgi:hypothetical protein